MTKRTPDLFLTGPTGLSSTTNNALLASAAAIDTLAAGAGLPAYRSFWVQVNGSSGISAGAVVFEGSNDNVNFTVVPYVDGAAITGVAAAAGITVAASTSRFFQGPIPFRYFRLRISTAFTGGTISATARLSTAPYSAAILQVGQATAANLKATANLTPLGSGGNSMATAALLATATQVKSGPGQVYGYDIHNPNAAISYVQFFNTAVGSVTVGTTTPVYVVGIPANSRASVEWPMGLAFSTAIVIAATTTRGGNTAPGTALDVNIIYT
jgi:hypothetical protein